MLSSLKVFLSSIAVLAVVVSPSVAAPAKPAVVELLPNAPLLHKHGRWDANNGTWWPGSGIKLVASGLTSFTLHAGEYTNWPVVSVSYSVDYSEFTTVNVSAGANTIPIPAPPAKVTNRVVRLNVEASTGTRLHLKKIELNPGAVVKPYKPSSLRFQFIGDSLTAGYLNPHGVNDAWSFQSSQKFKAEHNIMAASGACLTDIECFSNIHGISNQFFKTEDTSYRWFSDHNYTTPWDFKRELAPTHVFVVIGANDNSYNVPAADFASTLSTFIANLRTVYPKQPLFIFTPWGWSNGQSPFYTYYDGVYASVVDQKVAAGDKRIYLVNTTGWVQLDGVIPNDGHPNPLGHQQIVAKLTEWLGAWGLKPKTKWES